MKNRSLLTLFMLSAVACGVTSCKNSKVEFPDYEFSAAYFAYQTPVRSIILGDDLFDNTLDNEHKFELYATLSGLYQNKNTVSINIEVDNTLCDNLYFDDAATMPVKALPESHYKLTSNKIVLDKTLSDGVIVELTDAFFADADAINTNYVLPVRMTSISGADSILMGKAKLANAVSQNAEDWEVLPKDYVLYAVKYLNPWEANYLRRGVDKINNNGTITDVVRKNEYVERDELLFVESISMTKAEVSIPIPILKSDGTTENYVVPVTLTFDADNKCTASYEGSDGYTVTGSGEFKVDGEKNSWGNKDRNALYLTYTVDLGNGITVETDDTFVVRDRGVSIEQFTPTYK